jgi:centrosomal protein CEP120
MCLMFEGRKFPHSSSNHVLTAEAKFDGQIMVTDPVPQNENPNFTQELAWPVDRRALHQHKLQRSSLKIVVFSINPAVGVEGREEIGYVVLNLRGAQNQKVSSLCFLLFSHRSSAFAISVRFYVISNATCHILFCC